MRAISSTGTSGKKITDPTGLGLSLAYAIVYGHEGARIAIRTKLMNWQAQHLLLI